LFDDREQKESPFETPITVTAQHLSNILMRFDIDTEGLYEIEYLIDTTLTSPRHVAQIVGTEVLRTFDEDIHCKQLTLTPGINVVTDIRFLNEYNYFSKQSRLEQVFIPIYVRRESAESQVNDESHASEKQVCSIARRCVMIDNNGSLENTKKQVREILKEYFLLTDEQVSNR